MTASSLYHERIAALAHEYWVERGRPLGSPEVDWYRAVEAVSAEDDLRLAAFLPGLNTAAPGATHRRRM